MGEVKFTSPPKYNPRILGGVTKYDETTLRVKSIEIGKHFSDGDLPKLYTLLHEEMEARIITRDTPKHSIIMSLSGKESIDAGHDYMEPIIKRFFEMKGWDYNKRR